MSNQILIKNVFNAAWLDIKKQPGTWFTLTAIYIAILGFYGYIQLMKFANLENAQTQLASWNAATTVLYGCLGMALSWTTVLYRSIFDQSALDAAFHRPITGLSLSMTTIKATIITVLISLPFQLLSMYLETVHLPANMYIQAIFIGLLFALNFLMFYVVIRFSFADLIFLEQKDSIAHAFYDSWDLTDGKINLLLLFMLLAVGTIFLGIITLLLGIFIAFPMVSLMRAHLYKQLIIQQAKDVQDFIK